MAESFPSTLHLTPHLGGGVGRVLLNYLGAAVRKGQRHSLLCLDYANDKAKAEAGRLGVKLGENMFWDQGTLSEAIAEADILVVHWWNHPLLYAWMAGARIPKARTLTWSHVSGLSAPQIFTNEALGWPDLFAVANPVSFQAPEIMSLGAKDREARMRLIFSSAGLSHVSDYSVREHRDFRVGYLGTVDYAKMHQDFLGLCLAADVPDAVFTVAGGPSHESLRKEAEALGASDKFEILGPIDNVGEFLSDLDVFGYPLTRENYGTGEQVLIEAMAVGVPPVVFGHGCEEHVVDDGVTGLVADGPEEYSECVALLREDPALRKGLSKAAAENARARFHIDNTILAFDSVYEELLCLPKRERAPLGSGGLGPDGVFLLSQGSLATGIYNRLEEWASQGSPPLDLGGLPAISWSETRGSVFHYSSFFPDNRRLRRLSELMAALDPRKGGRTRN
ncbi:MAG: glycosyltransferase family 4 protein [Deltaproteobacteria bacterium]|jgi:glycosyltransferase involved in cell wall biosynthesis|nr:glycosyltransferase family 4 protein [Deltaproteobacteria bacterium]